MHQTIAKGFRLVLSFFCWSKPCTSITKRRRKSAKRRKTWMEFVQYRNCVRLDLIPGCLEYYCGNGKRKAWNEIAVCGRKLYSQAIFICANIENRNFSVTYGNTTENLTIFDVNEQKQIKVNFTCISRSTLFCLCLLFWVCVWQNIKIK